MGRQLLALAVVVYAFWRGDLLHPSPYYSLFLPLLGLAAGLYLIIGLLRRRGSKGSDAGGGDSGWSSGDADGCGGDGGGD